MSQSDLFATNSVGEAVPRRAEPFPDPDSVRAADERVEQRRQLERVGGNLAPSILRWCAARVGQEFQLSDFTAAIMAETGCAPDSPRRVLKMLCDEESPRVVVACIHRTRSRWKVVRA